MTLLQERPVATAEAHGAKARPPFLLYAVFGLSGIATVLLGVILPQIGAHGSFRDADAGRLLAVQFTGQLIGALLVAGKPRKLLLTGILVAAICAGCLPAFPGFTPELLFGYGIGLGLLMTATNILVGLSAGGAERASRLELLNTFWPVGAAICPWFAVALRSATHPLLPYAAVAAGFVGLFVPLLLSSRGITFECEHPVAQAQSNSVARLIVCCALALLAVGVESAIAGWLTTFGSRYLSVLGVVPWLPTLFWGGLLVGRLAASRALLSVRPAVYGGLSTGLGIAMALVLAASRSAPLMCLAACCCAFCFGPLYPMVLARSVHLRGKNFVFFSAGVGSALVPWTVGRTSMWTGSLRGAMLVAPAGAVLLLLVWVLDSTANRSFPAGAHPGES